MKRARLKVSLALFALALTALAGPRARAETLTEALAQAYLYNPQMLAQRAHLHTVDEGVPQALAGWRPTVQFTGSAGKAILNAQPTLTGSSDHQQVNEPKTLDLNMTQSLYQGGRTPALIDEAEHLVLAERAHTVAIEEAVLFSVVQAYLDVVRDQSVLELNINNEQVLRRQLEATNDQFRVGQVTRTDVAQSESRLALGTANRIAAEGQLQTSRANYQRAVGHMPTQLVMPEQRPLLPSTLPEAVALASSQNPNVVLADFNAKAAEDSVRATRGLLLPNISLVGDLNKQIEILGNGRETSEASIIVKMTMPLYEAGTVYSQTRQAKQTVIQQRDTYLDTRNQAVQLATADWQKITSGRAQIISLKSTITAAGIALDGVRQEAAVGSRTVLDVLNAEQELFTDRVNLVTAQHDLAISEFDLGLQIGRLTAIGLSLPVQTYDLEKYYKEVRGKWLGFGSKGDQ